MNTKNVKKYCPLSDENLNFLKNAAIKLKLSARSYYKTIKIARTIADLANSPQITTPHLAESLQYRPKHFSVD